MVASLPNGPVADFCAALRDLQVASGISRSSLAREIHYGRSQLYDILDGRIRRPPEWDRLVEPLLRTCLRGKPDVERLVADWRTRYEVLLRVHDELTRRASRSPERGRGPDHRHDARARRWSSPRGPALATADRAPVRPRGRRRRRSPTPSSAGGWSTTTTSTSSTSGSSPAWPAAPRTTRSPRSLATALSDTRLGLTQIRRLAQRFAVDVGEEPAPATVGLAAYLQAQLCRGYELVRSPRCTPPSRSTSTPGPRSGRGPTGPRRTGR